MDKKRPVWTLAALLTSGLLTGCGALRDPGHQRLAFTDGLMADPRWGSTQKNQLRFHTSDRITLALGTVGNLREVQGGGLVDIGLNGVRTIEIPAGAPGIVVGSGPDWLAVSFEPGMHLYFKSGQWPGQGLAKGAVASDDRYYLYAPDWNARRGTVQLGHTRYQAIDRSIDTFLTISGDALGEARSVGNALSNRWLDDRARRF